MPRPPRTALALLLASVLASGCVIVTYSEESVGGGGRGGRGDGEVRLPSAPATREGDAEAPDRGDFVAVWSQPPERYASYHDALREEEAFAAWVGALNAMLALPHDVTVEHAACGDGNAFYVPAEDRVVLCYELLDLVSFVMADLRLDPEAHAEAVGSVWLFVTLHEAGHALIDAYGLPVTGREEDAVDDLATLMLIDAGASDAAVSAAVFWILTDPGRYPEAAFADEHSLNAQRFYAILCTVHGSDPDEHRWMVREGYLSAERAKRCEREYERKDASWDVLLEPWRKSA